VRPALPLDGRDRSPEMTAMTPFPRMAVAAAAISAALVAGMTGTAIAFEDLDCDAFTYQEEAQAVLDEDPTDPHRLDGGPDGPADGIACESLPPRPVATTTPPRVATETTAAPTTPATPQTTTETIDPAATALRTADPATGALQTADPAAGAETTTPATTIEAPAVDRDCPDFATQADAQVALESTPGDPEHLDADNDGIACEDLFGTEGRQVAVVPLGGVATGGTPES
jgi:hypothetical protein